MWSSAATGQEVGQATLDEARVRGHALAKAHCAECHAVEQDDKSPTAVNANTAFRDLSLRFPIAMLEAARETGSIAGHDEMPGFDFSMSEIRDLLAYIDSFSPSGKWYLGR